MSAPPPPSSSSPFHSPPPHHHHHDLNNHRHTFQSALSSVPERSTVEAPAKQQDSSRPSSPSSGSHSRSSSLRRASFGSVVEEDGAEIAQSFVDTKSKDQVNNQKNNAVMALQLQPGQGPDFCCPCGAFLGWKQIPLGGRRQSRSFSDLRLLGNSFTRGWAWETPAPSAPAPARDQPKPPEKKRASLEMMPPEILDQIISYLALDIPPNGYTPRNVDLISCLLTCRTLHSATLGVLYRNITIPHSTIFSKALNHIRQYPSLGTIVRRLDFCHFTSVGLGRTQQMNATIQNLTARTLLECLNLLPHLKELLLQEHVEDDLDSKVLEKIFTGIPSLRALDLCGCSSVSFVSAFTAVTQNPNLPPTFPRLRRVSLHECSSLPDEAFKVLLPRLVNLTHLDLCHTQITNDTLFMISVNANISHLNIARCTRLTGPEVVKFVTTHPAVRENLVYLNLMVDVSRHRLLEEEDVDALLPHLPESLRSLNIGGARITSRHMPMLIKLSKHLEELGLNSAEITLEDINSFFIPPRSNEANWVRPELRYLDLTKNPYITQAALLNPKICVLATPQSYPLDVIELSEKIINPLRQRHGAGWVVRDLGRRGWYVRGPPSDPNDKSLMPDDGRRGWKMGARWWGMRKIPVAVGDVGGIYGHYMFKK
ncbi:hypothetical protein VTO42DRAFT_5531 [Malbranchea cinnamomea]